MRTFHCDKCAQQVFFENVRCESCGSLLGYVPEQLAVVAFEAAGAALWRSLRKHDGGKIYKQCENYAQADVCNWMLPADSPARLCASCELTRIIPGLSNPQNHIYWQRLEAAKRRLLYSLWELKLAPISKAADRERGLAFEFLEDMPGNRVMTGHSNGVITLNISEADPAHRERTREQMHEPYRTLLGHFRHESGHYYFDLLVAPGSWLTPFRELFGDERADYAQSLQRHYEKGPPEDWNTRYISAYASTHPWEDWAETWAHYLHMTDALDTAFACGLQLKPRKREEPELMIEERPLKASSFNELMDDWFALAYVLNSLNRSVGMPDPYPFALSPLVVQKLEFVHNVILSYYRSGTGPGSTQVGEPRVAV